MTATSKSIKSIKSMKTLRPAFDDNSDPEEELDDDYEINNLVFETALPDICTKFNCSRTVVVKKHFQRDIQVKLSKPEPTKTKYKRISMVTPSILHQTSITGIQNPGDTPAVAASGSGMFESGTVIIKAFYDNMDRLAEIVVRGVRVPRIVMQSIAILAPLYDQLTKITITSCNINAYTIHELNKMLPLTTLNEICLDDSSLREGNYAILLETTTRLRNLSLSRCHINDEVCMQIASKLHFIEPAGNTLLLLNLSSNRITDVGVKYLAEALRTNRRLRYLNLADNHITDTGAGYLLGALSEFPLTLIEVMDMRKRYLGYVRNRMMLYLKFLHEGQSKVGEEGDSVRKSGKKSGKTLDRTKSTAKSPTSNNAPNEQQMQTTADMLAGDAAGPFLDPFNKVSVTVRNGWTYSHGNLVLSYLNLSYNNLSYLTVKKIVDVLVHQGRVTKSTDCGLMKILLDGNYIPEACNELFVIQTLLLKNMSRFNSKAFGEAAGRRKSVASLARARISVIPESERRRSVAPA